MTIQSMHAGILTKGLRKEVHILYQSWGLDANTYIIEGSGNEDQDQDRDAGNQEEPPRHHPFEFEREDSILPPGSPCASMMPSPRSLPAPKTPSTDLSSPYLTSTPAPLQLSSAPLRLISLMSRIKSLTIVLDLSLLLEGISHH